MTRKHFILAMIAIVFLVSLTSVCAFENDTSVIKTTDNSDLSINTTDKLETSYFYDSDDDEFYYDDTVETQNVVKYYGDKSKTFKVTVYDDDYNLESGVYVSFGRDWDSLVEKTTNSKGVVVFPINYGVGKHNVMTYIECEEGDNYYISHNIVTVKSTIPTNVVSKHINEKSKKFSIKFLDTKGKALKNRIVKVVIKGKTYNIRTNAYGVTQITVNGFRVGAHRIIAINPASGERKSIQVKILKKYQVRTATAKVVCLKRGEFFSNKCTRLIRGDAIICFKEYSTRAQYPRGVNIDHWYCGKNGEDRDAHYTVLLKATLYYKNSKGKVITVTKRANKWGGIDTFSFVRGYNPYMVKVWYRDK